MSEASNARWLRFEGLPTSQKQTCEDRLRIVLAVEKYRAGGLGETAAVSRAAAETDVSRSSVFNYLKRLYGVPRDDWLAALAPDYRPTARRGDCSDDAWSTLKSDYLRAERPSFSACYRRVKAVAKRNGWTIPSMAALRRRMDAEVPRAVQVLARQGRDQSKTLYPAQRRDRGHLHAMQAVNMDGHELDVFVTGPDGKPVRMHLIALQDLYSGKIVAWRLSDRENKETVRLVIGDMVERHGIPEKILLDNGRAFASKWISGGTPNRYRFKVRDEDPQGLLTTLGIEIVWAQPYSGQSKPIERAFRDLTDDIARHPFCAGAYTGNRPDAKPENYGSKAIPVDDFREHVARQILEHNARAGRRSSVCNGRSFDQAFNESMAADGTLVKWPKGRTSKGRTSKGRTSKGRNSKGRTLKGRTSKRRTSDSRT